MLSSQVMMMMPFCENHGELMTGPMLLFSQVSPAVMSWLVVLLLHGEAVLVSPCMLSQSLGVIHTKSGAFVAPRAVSSPLEPGYGSTPSVLWLALLHHPPELVVYLVK